MNSKPIRVFHILSNAFLLLILLASYVGATVLKEGDKTYLVDQTGERWDITQAVSIGFDPDLFEFGIGRYAFEPLDDTNWENGSVKPSSEMRIIGIAGFGDAHAYSVRKLRHHETANTFLGPEAIVAGY